MDNHEAVLGHMGKTLESLSEVKPQFAADFPEAVREGADELTLRREENMLRTFLRRYHSEGW